MSEIEYIVDISKGFLHLIQEVNNPIGNHFYVEDLKLKSRSFNCKSYESEASYISNLKNISIDENQYLLEFRYVDETSRIRADFFIKQMETLPASLKGYFRELRINQILDEL